MSLFFFEYTERTQWSQTSWPSWVQIIIATKKLCQVCIVDFHTAGQKIYHEIKEFVNNSWKTES